MRCPELRLREAEGSLDFWQERGNGEPDEEGNEKGKPSAVESSHVRAFEAEHLDFSGLVILVGVNTDIVGIVLLPLLRLREEWGETIVRYTRRDLFVWARLKCSHQTDNREG